MQPIEFDPTAPAPLDGIRVIDLSRLVAGNMLSVQLADFGAEVIKIEPPGKGDPLRDWRDQGVSLHWKVYGRNKKSITLDLRHARAAAIVRQLAAGAQVLIESFRPGQLEAMGLAPAVLHADNQGLVIVRISGFGQTGPYRNRPGFGTLVEAMSGFAAKNGFADREPVLPPLALADMIAGLYGATATMVALHHRARTGEGQVVDLSLLEPMIGVLGTEVAARQLTGVQKPRVGSASHTASPRNVYRTADDKWIAISASIQSMAERLLRAIGRADMLADPRFATNSARLKHRTLVDAAVGEWIGQRTLAECLALFEAAEVTAGPVYDAADLMADAHVQGRGVLVAAPDAELGRLPMPAIVPRLSASPGAFRRPAPAIGEHNEEVLGALGLDVRALKAEGVI